MHKKSLSLLIGIISFALASGQKQDQVLLTIDETPIHTSEFKRVYLKNIDLVKDNSQKNVDEYLNLFINYKLKLKEAKALGLDKKESYLKELDGYKNQLAKGYLTDTKTSDALIKEAYERSLDRVNASHILVMVKPNAPAKDTVLAYQKISEARQKILTGESFEAVAKLYSEDPSVKKNNGELGWFSAFRMVYPFEDAAYKTKVGELSKPFRTQFGYHIVKVNNREKKLGEVTVAHIMIAVNNARTSEQAEQRITEINQQLEQGASFESLAKQFSDDPSTAIEGGKIRRFGQGVLNSQKFEKEAFKLQKKGEISAPLKTKYGWHIIQLIEKHPLKTFEELEEEFTKKVQRDGRSKLVTKSFINSLKDKYSITQNEEAIAYFKKNVPDSIIQKGWNIPENEILKKELFKVKQSNFTYRDFAEFIRVNHTKERSVTDVPTLIERLYEKFESTTLLAYYEEHLEEDNQDYANVIGEYRDGLLLFDLMESKIWNASKKDSIGLKRYYESQKKKYSQEETYKLLKASSVKKDIINKVESSLKKSKSIEEIKKEVNKGDTVLVIFSEEEVSKEDNKLPKGFKLEKGKITIAEEENFITLILVKEIIPSRIKTFEEVRGEVINDYQKNIENKWLDELRTKYMVKVDKKAFKKIKNELSI